MKKLSSQGKVLQKSPKHEEVKPTEVFTQALAREIVKNLVTIGQLTTRGFHKRPKAKHAAPAVSDTAVLVDTSVLIDGRIVPVVNSGFFTGELVIPEFVIGEVQHIADSADSLRRSKGRRGLEVVSALRGQKVNKFLTAKIMKEDAPELKEIDRKLVELAKRWSVRLLTVDFNLAQAARAQGIKVLNMNDLGQAVQIALVPGEELSIRIAHEGREREQGVGYLMDGTMVVVDRARDKVGKDLIVVVTKVHQTPAGQLFFARLK
ncbi:hypothetical protein KKB64_04125 [Patescibacteria group bacterium]|nr:hypothetical protein [Patescibacteria group bacterium]MBU1472945.1 hypothetical protein [Patescibacteria group bacterium]MBU2459707.1 hypothetical protein [Patescibacteria group bacterium]